MVVCPELIGRTGELGTLTRLIADTVRERAVTVALISGEAGIGKTRLAEEVVRRSACGVVRVACSEPARSVPHGAVTEVLGDRHVDPAPPPRTASGSDRAARSVAKLRHHRSLVDALEAVFPTGRGRLLVIEDLHWADEAMLDWLPHLLRAATGPLTVIVTLRDERADVAFASCLAEVERLRVSTVIRLGPLARDEIVHLVDLMPADTADADDVADLADGNPLFAEELAMAAIPRGRGGWDHTSALPRVVQLTFAERSASLGEPARHLLSSAAVLGRDFTMEQLSCLGSPGDAVGAAVDELVVAGLVVQPAPGWFAFRHALFRAAAYDALAPSLRASAHRRIAVALESGMAGRPELRAAELLHHWSLAGDADRMGEWGVIACDRALAAHCPADAVTHATAAIEALTRLRGEAPRELLRLRAEAAAWLGHFDQAASDHRAALAVASASDDMSAQWRSLVDLGLLAIEADFDRAGDHLEEALVLARALGDDRNLAESLGHIGFWHMMGGDPAVALAHQQEALDLLDRLGDVHAAGELLDLMGWTNYVLADLDASRDAYRRGVALNRTADSPLALASCRAGYATRGADCFQLDSVWCDGEPLAWAADGQEAVEYARSLGWRSGEARGLIWLGLHLVAIGEHQQAFDCANGGLAIAVDDGQVRFQSTAHILLSAIWLDLLDPARASAHAATAWRLANELRSTTVAATAASFLARAQVAAGSLDAAAATLRSVRPVARNSMPDRLLSSARAELLLVQGDAAASLDEIVNLAASAPNAGRVVPHTWYLKGLALTETARLDEAHACLAEAASEAKRLRQRPVLWRALVAAGHSMERQGAAATASECYRSARRVIDELADSLTDPTVGQAFKTTAANSVPSTSTARVSTSTLTAREREIAALVARGLSNREIADHVVLSIRTVEKHVANALTKLHMRSRVELAVWAADHTP